MKEELKIYIDNYKEIEEKLQAIGAKFVREIHVTDIYLNQPEGFVLKFTEDDRGYFLTKLQAHDGGFRFITQEPLNNPEETKKKLEVQYGVKCILKKKRRFWDFENYNINLNLFEDIGNFLIIEGEKVTPDIITEKLGIKNPKYLTISFDKLKEQQMKSRNVKAILFDLGGVLFTNGTKKFVEYTSEKYGLDKEKIKNIVDKGEIPDAYREGRIGRDEFWTKVKQELNLPEDIETLEREWINRYELIQGTKDILQELAKKYKIYFLSDNVKERVEAIDKKFDFLSWFETGVFSHEAGVRKPHPKIYQLALQKAGVKPEEAVFIDDKESALKPASEMGMTTILFESPEQLQEELKQLRILN